MFKQLNSSRFSAPTLEFAPEPAPILQWIETDRLVVDTEYQREIGRRGATNVIQIAEHFDWSKFAPVIVAPIEGGRFAIVDGQHRTTAAMLRDIKEVPCQVVQAGARARPSLSAGPAAHAAAGHDPGRGIQMDEFSSPYGTALPSRQQIATHAHTTASSLSSKDFISVVLAVSPNSAREVAAPSMCRSNRQTMSRHVAYSCARRFAGVSSGQ